MISQSVSYFTDTVPPRAHPVHRLAIRLRARVPGSKQRGNAGGNLIS